MSQNCSRTRRFFLNSSLLVAVSLVMRGVGVAFNIYVTNKAGAETVGLYSLLSGVYGFAITLATSGIGLAMTRLISEALGKGDQRAARSAVRAGTLYALLFGTGAGILLFALAQPLGATLIGDVRTVRALRVLALTLPPIAVCSCLSGYFTAVRRVGRNAAAQILAQGARIFLTVFFLSLFLPRGIEYACLALVIGGALSEAIALALSAFLYLRDSSRTFSDAPAGGDRSMWGKLLAIGLPVACSAYVRSGLVTVEHILIPRGLKKSGASWKAALSAFGILHSMVLPVVLFPSAFITSFSGLLIPEVAESRVLADTARIRRIAFRIFTLSMFFAVGVSGVMLCFSEELGCAVAGTDNVAQTVLFIRRLAPLIPIMYVDSAVDAILKGMGEQVYSMNVNIIDAAVSVLLVWILLPVMGLSGYIITIYVTETLNTTLSITRMLRVTGMRPRLWHQVFGPVTCVIGATCASRLLFQPLTGSITPVWLSFAVHAATSALLYLALLCATGIFGAEEREILRAMRRSSRRHPPDSADQRKHLFLRHEA